MTRPIGAQHTTAPSGISRRLVLLVAVTCGAAGAMTAAAALVTWLATEREGGRQPVAQPSR